MVLVHGFPESWHSYRHQLKAIAEAGFTAAAIHVRGYGESSKPAEVEAYTSRELAGDIIALIDSIDPGGTAVLVGHDWGSVIVQNTTLMYPERVRGLVTLAVPTFNWSPTPTVDLIEQLYGDKLFYQSYFSEPGVAEAEINQDMRKFVKMFFYWLGGEHPDDDNILIRPGGSTTLMGGLAEPAELPAWFSEADLDFYTKSFVTGGITGPLNRYRAHPLDFDDVAQYADERFSVPTLFIGGDRDPSRWIYGVDDYADPLARSDVPAGVHRFPEIGHWVQQEAPERVNEILIPFLKSIQ